MSAAATGAVGTALTRIEARAKVTGEARYAYEHTPPDAAYAVIVQASIAKGAIRQFRAAHALAVPGVHHVIWAGNAPQLGEEAGGELAVLQSRRVAYRGQVVAIVVADSLPTARHAAGLVEIDYEAESHDVVLREDHPRLYKPEKVNPTYETDTSQGDVDAGLASAVVSVDATYRTPAEHNNPMEPHASVAIWDGDDVTVHDSNQGATTHQGSIARAFGLDTERVHVISEHVGGGFGSKGTPRPTVIAAVMAAKVAGRPVKLAATRQQMFDITGYRTPTIQRLRLGADGDGRLTAVSHEVYEQTSTLEEFAEQTATATRKMYATPNLHTAHRLVALDVPTPSWMRAPGECPGMYALESAMDELAVACGIDPVGLRILNEPSVDPETGKPFTSRSLVECLRVGAARFGWHERDPMPGIRRDGPWLWGTGVAASTYPARRRQSQAIARVEGDGHYRVMIAAADIGTGARTALTQVAADALGVASAGVTVEIGDSDLPPAMLAGGSMGLTSWGSAVVGACERLRELIADGIPEDGAQAHYDTESDVKNEEPLPAHSFGAQFMEVRVNADSGEVQVVRGLGVFAAGRIINPLTARSQFLGGMTMGIGMALHEESILDVPYGDYLNHDLAQYHIPACADIEHLEAEWIDERDDRINPLGAKGIGEIGIVGTAAAVGSAVHHATGVRIRALPIVPSRVLEALGGRT
ncbi:MAG TPA: xanthine dehydrogenase family protein molybdopterin-binding subunit [Solirubrobacteraceae bacterium]|jgi:xanthine dehydrogenase YagR molybdenum-binding subunit